MESRVKLLGHPVHQMLIPLPAGLFIMGAILDIAGLFSSAAWIPTVSYWNIGLGVLTGALAALFGWADWSKIPGDTRAKRVGLLHGIGNAIALVLFAVAFALRMQETAHHPGPGALAIEVFSLLLLGVTAWLGGELVDRLGVGVDEGAHLNAPSSLREKHVQLRS
jgi:uncharacterized membrane protein